MNSRSIKKVPFYYVRHGQTDWNLENRAMGQKDIPLNNKGINQALLARNHLMGKGIATICHSPLLRAKMTAELFNEKLNCRMIEIDEIKEFNLGTYEGQIKDKWFQDWRLGSDLPQAESYSQFITRCLLGINKALETPAPVLIIAHGGVYWAIEEALQVKLEGDIANCMPVFHEPSKNPQENWVLFPSNSGTVVFP